MVKQSETLAWKRERGVTRVLASAVGGFFVVGCPLSFIIHPELRVELVASTWKMLGFCAACLFSAAAGLQFLWVGITGQVPLWFRRCAQQGPRSV